MLMAKAKSSLAKIIVGMGTLVSFILVDRPTTFVRRPNLNFGPASGQRSPTENPSSARQSLQQWICSRCLSPGHARRAYKFAIRCYACELGGQIAINCPGARNLTDKWRKITIHNDKGVIGQGSLTALETD